MTLEEFLDRIDDIMCGTSNAERAYLADLYDEVTKPHWISVEEELPPMRDMSGQSDDVLVAFKYGVGVDYYDHGTNEWATGVGITHWMPLPQAPRKGCEK